jgi:hypothetical protein
MPAQKLSQEVGPRSRQEFIGHKLYNENSLPKNDEFATRNAILRLGLVIKDAIEKETKAESLFSHTKTPIFGQLF